MELIPYKKFNVKSNRSADEIYSQLSLNTAPVKGFPNRFNPIRSESKDFAGFTLNDKFYLKRILRVGYSAFLPIAELKITNNNHTNTIISIKVKMNNRVNQFLIMFFIFFTLVSSVSLISAYSNPYDNEIEEINQILEDSNIDGVDSISQNNPNFNINTIIITFLPLLIIYTIAVVYFNLELKLIYGFLEMLL